MKVNINKILESSRETMDNFFFDTCFICEKQSIEDETGKYNTFAEIKQIYCLVQDYVDKKTELISTDVYKELKTVFISINETISPYYFIKYEDKIYKIFSVNKNSLGLNIRVDIEALR